MKITNKYHLKHTIISGDQEETLLCEDIINGYNVALVKRLVYDNIFRKKLEYGQIVFRVDISKWQKARDVGFRSFSRGFCDELFKRSKIKLDFLPTSIGSSVSNVSPSLWENGFGKCEYLNFTLLNWNSVKEIMTAAISGGVTEKVLIKDFETISKDIMSKLNDFFNFISIFGKPIIPSEDDWF